MTIGAEGVLGSHLGLGSQILPPHVFGLVLSCLVSFLYQLVFRVNFFRKVFLLISMPSL